MGSCLDYMERLQDPAIFRFCAIPQIMAIATLSLCYNNHTVFTGAGEQASWAAIWCLGTGPNATLPML